VQSRKWSAFESLANVAVGYFVAVGAQAVIFPLFGIHVAASDHLAIGGLFTVVSLVRSYALRRVFNRLGR
jgi:membrane protein implicated in regulation of membrane protease activity